LSGFTKRCRMEPDAVACCLSAHRHSHGPQLTHAEDVSVNWQPVIEFFVSVGYGVLSSLIPIFNSEIYIVA